MKISKVIFELNEIKDRLGNIEVRLPQVNDDGSARFNANIEVIEVDIEKDGEKVAVIY